MQDEKTTERQLRAARNQSLFREVNERIERIGAGRGVELRQIDFACECATAQCAATLPMTFDEYEAVRRVPTHFAVLPGHVVDDVERVVEEHRRFVVVEKFGAAGVEATRNDPRHADIGSDRQATA